MQIFVTVLLLTTPIILPTIFVVAGGFHAIVQPLFADGASLILIFTSTVTFRLVFWGEATNPRRVSTPVFLSISVYLCHIVATKT